MSTPTNPDLPRDRMVFGSSTTRTAMMPSVVRTIVPWVAGVLLVALAKIGLHLEPGTATTIAQLAVAAVYYALVRYLETTGNARWGWLLGLAKAPAYSAAHAPSPDSPEQIMTTDPAVDPESPAV